MICTSLSLSQNIPDTYNAHTLQACDTYLIDHVTQQLHIGISTNQNLHIHFYEWNSNDVTILINWHISIVSLVILKSFWISPLQTKLIRIFN